ncbi:MAG: efflux RND transporter permease subunit [Candidatus Omnitrophica bacterium]|nr:efflux RND transporter permease subunit [Candidatus Omnitrophota bacterium]
MIEFFVKRPVTTTMFILLFVVLGLVSYTNLNIESTPRIDFPIVTVKTIYAGATPLEVETLVNDKIEDQVAELSEIKTIESFAYEGMGLVMVEFLLSADVNTKFIEVKDKVEAISNDLPGNAERSIVEKFDPLMTPVLNMVLLSDTKDGVYLYEYADKFLKNELSKVEGVANVEIFGGRQRQINVLLDPMLMKKHYITISEVIDKIDFKNRNVPGGTIEKKQASFNVRFIGEFTDVDEIANMVLTSEDGSQFKLKDIAIIEDSAEEMSTAARFNGKDCVALSVNKVSDGNAVNIARKIRRQMDKLKEKLPEGVELKIATDTTTFIIDETKEARFNIILGICLTVVAIYLFTGRWKLTLIGSIIIPASVVSTFFLMDLSGFSFNIMTLLAIAVSLGTLIANAIVIIESVLMHLERGKSSVDAAIDGTKEVSNAVIASAGTNLVVFTPIAFMGGIVGKFFESFGLTVVYATIFSLIASFSLTPMMCALLLSEQKDQKRGVLRKILSAPFRLMFFVTDKIFMSIEHVYEKFFNTIFRFPFLTLVGVIAFFALVIAVILPYVGNEFYPNSDQDQILAKITMPQGTKIEKTLEAVEWVEQVAARVSEKKSIFTDVGNNGEENASVYVDLTPSKQRERSDLDIINGLIPQLAVIPDADIVLVRSGGMGDASQGDVSINVFGIDYDEMVANAQKMKQSMEQSGYFRAVTSSYKLPKDEVLFIPDQNKLINYNVDNSDIGDALRYSIYGNDMNVYKENGEEYDINVELIEDYMTESHDIEQIGIISVKGLVPITELGQLVESKAIPTIRHIDRQRIIRLEGFLSKSNLGFMRKYLDECFKDIDFQPGYGYTFAGDSDNQDETNQEVGKAFFLAIVLTFMILAALMNSFVYPFPSFSLIILSYTGVFISLFFTEETINVSSLLGMVMLVGLVINDAILVIDYTLMKLKEGVELKEAIRQGVTVKFRAVILTTIAVILGTWPQLSSVMPLKTSMSAAIIGGMAAAGVLTFVFIPVAFLYTERFRRWIGRLRS